MKGKNRLLVWLYDGKGGLGQFVWVIHHFVFAQNLDNDEKQTL